MPRDMSYRKPVPKYVPSPSPSPPSSPVSPFVRLSFSVGSAVDQSMPPLPNDWREIIQQAFASDELNTSLQKSCEYQNTDELVGTAQLSAERLETSARTVDDTATSGANSSEHPNGWLYSPPRSPAFSPSGPGRRPKRKLHRSYRPPTPPLPAEHKRQKLSDHGPELLEDRELDLEGAGIRSSSTIAPSSRVMSLTTRTSSFRTEKTQFSCANSEPSTMWSGTTMCIVDSGLPVLPMQISSGEHKTDSMKRLPGPVASWWRCVGNNVRTGLGNLRKMVIGVFAC